MAEIHLPARSELREVFAGLLGDVAVQEGKPPADAPSDCVSIYVDDTGQLAAVCVVDFPLAVAAGAAIALVPASVAEEARDGGKVTNQLRDNLREVMNVLATLLCSEDTPHVKFRALHLTRAEAPADALALAAKPAARLDVNVDLGDYGAGALALLVR